MMRVRIGVLLALAVVLHTTVLADLRIAGIRPDGMLLVAVAAGFVTGPERGAVIGFVAGLLADLFLYTPLGLSALTYALIGYGVGRMQGTMLRSAWWIGPLTAFVASAGGIVLFALAGATLGESDLVTDRLPLIALWVAVMHAVLSLGYLPALRWATRPARLA